MPEGAAPRQQHVKSGWQSPPPWVEGGDKFFPSPDSAAQALKRSRTAAQDRFPSCRLSPRRALALTWQHRQPQDRAPQAASANKEQRTLNRSTDSLGPHFGPHSSQGLVARARCCCEGVSGAIPRCCWPTSRLALFAATPSKKARLPSGKLAAPARRGAQSNFASQRTHCTNSAPSNSSREPHSRKSQMESNSCASSHLATAAMAASSPANGGHAHCRQVQTLLCQGRLGNPCPPIRLPPQAFPTQRQSKNRKTTLLCLPAHRLPRAARQSILQDTCAHAHVNGRRCSTPRSGGA